MALSIYTRPMRMLRPLSPWLIMSTPLLVMLAVVGIASGFDENVVLNVCRTHREAHTALASTLNVFTDFGNYAFYSIYLFLLIRAWRMKDKPSLRFVLVYITVQIAISLIAVRFIKSVIGRPRPGEDPFFQTMTNRPSYHSLPSGHTTEATCSALALTLRWRGWWTIGLGLALGLMGFTRIYLGWHHPSDVFFGWMLGSVGGLAVHLFSHPAQRTTA